MSIHPGPAGHSIRRALGIVSTFACVFACSALLPAAPAAAADQDRIFVDGMEEFVLLQGEARFLTPLADAEVVVGDGSPASLVTTTADENGLFSLKYVFTNRDALVEVRARGIGAQEHEEYASYLGDLAFLVDKASEDRSLDVTDLPSLRLNPHSTMLYVAMRDQPESAIGEGASDFLRRARSVSVLDMYDRGALIAMLARGDVPLPAGAATTLEAVSSEAMALEAQLEVEQDTSACPENPICSALALAANDAGQVAVQPPPLDVEVQAYLAPGLGNGVSALGFLLEPGGGGRLIPSPVPSPTFEVLNRELSWSTDGDEIVLQAAGGGPLTRYEVYAYRQDCACQVLQVTATTAIRILLARGPGDVLLLGYSEEQELSYPDNPGIPTVTFESVRPYAVYPAVVDSKGLDGGFGDPAGSTIILPRCLHADCSVPEQSVFGPQVVVNEPHRFHADNTGTTLRLGDDFTWMRDSLGRLYLNYSSGASSRYVLAAAATPVAATATGVFNTPAFETMDVSDDIVWVAEDVAFDEASLPGRYVSMIGAMYPYAILSAFSPLRPGATPSGFEFLDGGQGGDLTGTRALAWELDLDGRLSFTRENTSSFPSTLYPQRRNWELIGQDQHHIYVLEAVQVPDPITGELDENASFAPTSRLLAYRRL